MTTSSKTATALVAAAIGAGALLAVTGAQDASAKTVTVRIGGGHATAPVDHGRPVVLVAAGLGVPTAVFRTAFSGVTPAGAGEEPDPAQVQRNKAALLKVLAPYGVTNDDLDRVSNYYRYVQSAGEMWPTAAATAKATIKHGKVVAIKLTGGGAGYSSTPAVSVPGYPGTKVRVALRYGRNLSTNGRIAAIKVLG
jgi:hypothetical protein